MLRQCWSKQYYCIGGYQIVDRGLSKHRLTPPFQSSDFTFGLARVSTSSPPPSFSLSQYTYILFLWKRWPSWQLRKNVYTGENVIVVIVRRETDGADSSRSTHQGVCPLCLLFMKWIYTWGLLWAFCFMLCFWSAVRGLLVGRPWGAILVPQGGGWWWRGACSNEVVTIKYWPVNLSWFQVHYHCYSKPECVWLQQFT